MVESGDERGTARAGFFRVPGLFVRLSSKGLSNAVDADSVWSPTSPLDFKSFRSSPPRVGLGLVDALTADGSSSSLRIGGRCSFLDSIRPFLEPGLPKAAPARGKANSAGATLGEAKGYAESEEYTCVIARGPNARTTHILGGETLQVREAAPRGSGSRGVVFTVEPLGHQAPPSAPAGVASGRCDCCMKRLHEDRDVYMYLGEKAFCSNDCRKGYIEEIEEAEELKMQGSAPMSWT